MRPVIYQLVVRLFGNLNPAPVPDGTLAQNGSGTFADINAAALDSLAKLGVTHVWLTGVLRQATLTDHRQIGLPPDDPDVVKGIAGSFYAVRDYFDVCPDYAVDRPRRMAEFEALVDRVHAAGMRVLVDFVGNHVARGYGSVVCPALDFGREDDTARFFAPDNAFFHLVQPPGQALRLSRPARWNPPVAFDGRFAPEDGGPGRVARATANNQVQAAPAATDWYEAVKLNWGFDFTTGESRYDPPPRTWTIFDAIVAFWQARGVDGFRCDFAHYIPAEAWRFLIGRARARRAQTMFVAEAYPYVGSGDPVVDRRQLTEAGFDAIYHSASYDALKRLYQGVGTLDAYVADAPAGADAVVYLENHDERRIASAIVRGVGPGESGFGSAAAGYQLAPVQFLWGAGPVLVLNGQELGEPGEGTQGFSEADGRSTIFDYASLPAMLGWVNGHTYDGAGMTPAQAALRGFMARLLALCQEPAATGTCWRIAPVPSGVLAFARFRPGDARLLLVAANFRPGETVSFRLPLPGTLMAAAGLPARVSAQCVLDRQAAEGLPIPYDREALGAGGIALSLPDQTAQVWRMG